MLDSITVVEMGECASKMTYLRSAVAQKISLHHILFSLVFRGYGPNLQNEMKFETTSCSIVEKMTFNERPFCTVCLWETN